MPEAVIVATARSPIGRAFKGSLKDLRPDDLAATIVRAALDKVPSLDPRDIDNLMLGCGLPGGEQGYNMGRVVSVLLGMDHLPGTTITRYCSSSLQTTRMALHAIKAGEGDVFVAAGVETVSRFMSGMADMGTAGNPRFADAVGVWPEAADRGLLGIRRDTVRPVAQAAVRAASRPGTEVQATAVRGQDTGPRGPWARLRRRRPPDLPTPEQAERAAETTPLG